MSDVIHLVPGWYTANHSGMAKQRQGRLKPIAAGEMRRVGANCEATLYNSLLEFATQVDVDMSWVARKAFREFVQKHEDALRKDPVQLALDLGLD